MSRLLIWLAAALLLAVAPPAFAAGEIVLTMGDLPLQPVNGLVHPSGVQFGFTVGGVASTDAYYHSSGPGPITYVQDPSIEGTVDGVLSVIFPAPTPTVKFGLARSNLFAIPNGAAVELFDAANTSLGITSLNLNPMPNYAEVQFTYSGTAVKRMTVGFPGFAGTGGRFAFDNLAFIPVPEPASVILMCGGFALSFASSRSRQRRF